MNVTIHGPNLYDQSKGQFHVHEATCRDNVREVTYNGSEGPWTIEADSRLAVVEEVYHDQLNEQPDNDDGPQREATKRDWLQSEFHFAPCCDDLKEES